MKKHGAVKRARELCPGRVGESECSHCKECALRSLLKRDHSDYQQHLLDRDGDRVMKTD